MVSGERAAEQQSGVPCGDASANEQPEPHSAGPIELREQMYEFHARLLGEGT
jgi:hypothetical protein